MVANSPLLMRRDERPRTTSPPCSPLISLSRRSPSCGVGLVGSQKLSACKARICSRFFMAQCPFSVDRVGSDGAEAQAGAGVTAELEDVAFGRDLLVEGAGGAGGRTEFLLLL